MTNVAISLWWLLKPVSVTLLLSKEGVLFVRIKSIDGLCVFVIKVSFLINNFKWNKLQNCFNLSWWLFEISIFILKSPMTINVLYDSWALFNESENLLKSGLNFENWVVYRY